MLWIKLGTRPTFYSFLFLGQKALVSSTQVVKTIEMGENKTLPINNSKKRSDVDMEHNRHCFQKEKETR